MTTRTLRRFNRKGSEAFEQCIRGMQAGQLENHLPLLESEDLKPDEGFIGSQDRFEKIFSITNSSSGIRKFREI